MVHFSIAARPAVTDDVREVAQDVGDERACKSSPRVQPDRDIRRPLRRSLARSARAAGRGRRRRRSLHFFDPETGLGIYDGTPTKGAA